MVNQPIASKINKNQQNSGGLTTLISADSQFVISPSLFNPTSLALLIFAEFCTIGGFTMVCSCCERF
jgi:hypothetical protein